MDNVTRKQLNLALALDILSDDICKAIEDDRLHHYDAEIAMKALEDDEDFYDLYNYINVNFS